MTAKEYIHILERISYTKSTYHHISKRLAADRTSVMTARIGLHNMKSYLQWTSHSIAVVRAHPSLQFSTIDGNEKETLIRLLLGIKGTRVKSKRSLATVVDSGTD